MIVGQSFAAAVHLVDVDGLELNQLVARSPITH
jgi:hypothetical protein